VKIVEQYRAAHQAAIAAGWEITHTGSGHLRWKPPRGAPIFTPSTPSSYRGIKHDLSRLRRAGLKIGR
jgi:hypothetical protein